MHEADTDKGRDDDDLAASQTLTPVTPWDLSPGTPAPRAAQRSNSPAVRLLEGLGFNVVRLSVDVVMLVLAVVAARVGAGSAGAPTVDSGVLYAFPVLAVALFYVRGLYSRRLRVLILDGIAPLVSSISVAAMLCIAVDVIISRSGHPGPLVSRAWLFAIIYVGAGRILVAFSQRRARMRGVLARPTLIVGAGTVAVRVAHRLEEHPEYGLAPVGFLDDDPLSGLQVVDRHVPVLGGLDDLGRAVVDTGAGHVILAFTRAPDSALVPLIRQCAAMGLETSIVPRMFESVNERLALDHLGGLPLFGLRTIDPKGFQFDVKHALDRVFAAFGLVVLASLLVPVALVVKLSSPGPVLFRQRRVGRDGREFDLLKFRSMRSPDDPKRSPEETAGFQPVAGMGPGGVEGADHRTPIGRLIRRTSIDELPQLFNVFRGQMSIIGPRPERPEFVSLFREDINRYSDRHRVKSGITGWAQVHGFRGQTSLADRVEWDNFYIENWSLWLDVKILLLTITAVLRSAE